MMAAYDERIAVRRARRSARLSSGGAVLLTIATLLQGPAMAQSCIGDCNSDGHVTVSELITAVNIDLGLIQLDACPSIDCNARFPGIQLPINCIVAAVYNAMQGCDVMSGCTQEGTVVTCTFPP